MSSVPAIGKGATDIEALLGADANSLLMYAREYPRKRCVCRDRTR